MVEIKIREPTKILEIFAFKTKAVQRESTFVRNAFDLVGLIFDNRKLRNLSILFNISP